MMPTRSIKTDRTILMVFGLLGLTAGVILICVTELGEPGTSIYDVSGHQLADGTVEMSIGVLGYSVYRRSFATIEDMHSFLDVGAYLAWIATALTCLVLGLCAGYCVSFVTSYVQLRRRFHERAV